MFSYPNDVIFVKYYAKNCIISSTRPRLSGARNYTHVLFVLCISSSVLGPRKISVFLLRFLIVYIWGCWRLDIESLQSIAINILIFLLGDPHPIYPIWPGKGPPSKFICLCFQFKACVIQGKLRDTSLSVANYVAFHKLFNSSKPQLPYLQIMYNKPSLTTVLQGLNEIM